MIVKSKDRVQCGRLLVQCCIGLFWSRGGGAKASDGSENGLSPSKFEALNPQTPAFSYLRSQINSIKLTHGRQPSHLELCQINLSAHLHNLFQPDDYSPLELILAITSTEPYSTGLLLPLGSQPLLDAHRYNQLKSSQHELFKVETGIKLLQEVGLGADLIHQLKSHGQSLKKSIQTILASYNQRGHSCTK